MSGKHRAFLASFKLTASVTRAAKQAGVDRGAHYDWLKAVSGYPEAFAAAQEEAAQSLEDEIVRRAHEGTVEPVYYQGKAIGARRLYSDNLAMFLLRGLRPEKYRERGTVEHSGPGGGPIESTLTVTFVRPPE